MTGGRKEQEESEGEEDAPSFFWPGLHASRCSGAVQLHRVRDVLSGGCGPGGAEVRGKGLGVPLPHLGCHGFAVRPCLFGFFYGRLYLDRYLLGAGFPEEYIYAVFLGEFFQICRIQRFLVRQWIHVTASLRLRGYSDPAIDSRPPLRGVLFRC